MRPITERVIKFTANSLEINTDYEKDTQILFSGEGEIRSVEDTTNSDGTDRRKYKLEPLSIELEQRGEIIKEVESAKPKKTSDSQMLRWLIQKYWERELRFKYKDFETYYHAVMVKYHESWKEKLT